MSAPAPPASEPHPQAQTMGSLTGDEPSLRKDLPSVIAAVSGVPGVRKITLTTQSRLLPTQVRTWREAGLTALNVSLDSLDPIRFCAITGHDRFDEVRVGIELALTLGLEAVKLNAVLLRDCNDDELPRWLDYLRGRALSVRATDAGPARDYAHPAFRGTVGVIAPYAKDFCAGCNRLRVTARGECLFGDLGIALRSLLQSDADHAALVLRIATQRGLKATGHGLHQGQSGLTPHLASIGG